MWDRAVGKVSTIANKLSGPKYTDAEMACSQSVAIGITRFSVDATFVAEGGGALKAVGKAAYAELKAGAGAVMSGTARTASSAVDRAAGQAAAASGVANASAAAITGAVGKSLTADASLPNQEQSGFKFSSLVPFSGMAQDVRNGMAACNPR